MRRLWIVANIGLQLLVDTVTPMHSSLYLGLSALLVVWLSVCVIKLRRKHKVSLGDGGREDLRRAISAQANACQYLPIALIMLVAMELNQAPWWLVHLTGLVLVGARLLHAGAMLELGFGARVLGMQLTFFAIIALAIINVAYPVRALLI